MKHIVIWAVVAIVSVLGFSCASKNKSATTQIPEKREFPVSSDINPCNDFFKYACNGAISNFKLREDRSRHIFAFNDSYERVLNKKKSYLTDLLGKDSGELNVRSKQLKNYFASCMDTKQRKSEEQAVVASKVKEILAISSKEDLVKYLTLKSLEGQESHLSFGNIANLGNSDIYDLIVMPSRMTSMPERSYYKNRELMLEFKAIATEFFKKVGADKAAQRAQWVTDFETKYINLYPTPAERRKIWTMNKYSTPSRLKGMTPRLKLDALLAKVPKKTKIRNPMDKTFIKVNALFQRSSLDQLKSVYLYQVLSGLMDEAYPKFFKRKFAFNNKFLGGPPKRPELSERCAQDVMGKFTKEIDKELFEVFFPNFPEKKFIELLEKVRDSILAGLEKNTWLSKTAKSNGIKKIKAAKFQVVRPKTDKEWDFNPVVDYKSSEYIGNQLALGKKLSDREFERLPKTIDKSIWYMGPLTVNAYYDPTKNKFVMPAGILQYPFYDPTLPDWVNLGAVGAVVGHELGHGVDDQGSKYDERGMVRQWMKKSDLVTFKKRGESLIRQFEQAGHNGKLTLGENIGDLVGVTFALNAAKKSMPKDTDGQKKATQEFFLQWARAWCGVMRPKMVERQLKTDPHALVWARVNEQMKHQPDFAKVYSCKAGDKLVLPEKDIVRIW